jgi:N-acetylglucosamine-6-phosphate deacetylase
VTELRGLLLLAGELVPGVLSLEAGRIKAVQPGALDPDEEPCIIAPGLIDLHIHGFGLREPLSDLAGMAQALARAGTTAFQPTLFPAAPSRLGEDCEAVWSARGKLPGDAADPVGLHLEGPFVNPDAAGALPRSDLALPSLRALGEILGSATGDARGVRTVTVAPELAGADLLIAELVRLGVRVSLGHSRALAIEARAATRAGASGVTHLYNAMGGATHRRAGLAGLALTEDVLFAEIIGDLVHVEREAFDLALRARGPEGLCLVSDALAGAGTGCERFEACGREHIIQDGAAYYPVGPERAEPQLAGSALAQLEMVQRLVAQGVLSLPEALTMASATPARALGLEGERGSLAAGLRADLIVLEPESLVLREVWLAGKALGTAS